MTVVLDACVALKWGLHEENTEEALALLDLWQDRLEKVVAPPIFRSEVTNVLHRRVRQGQIDVAEAREMLDSLIALVAIVEPPGLYVRALTLGKELDLSSTYDAVYLALAESEGCQMWTADYRFLGSVKERFPQVRGLTEGL